MVRARKQGRGQQVWGALQVAFWLSPWLVDFVEPLPAIS